MLPRYFGTVKTPDGHCTSARPSGFVRKWSDIMRPCAHHKDGAEAVGRAGVRIMHPVSQLAEPSPGPAPRSPAALSVVIPTHNRASLLQGNLDALRRQTFRDFDVIVVDDGSTDRTPELLAAAAREGSIRIGYVRQENRGPAAARNVGVLAAKGRIVLFLDDDVRPEESLISRHVAAHTGRPGLQVAALGRVVWSPEMRPDPFQEWLSESGQHYGYALITTPQNVPYGFFNASNVSVKRDFLISNGLFDESFHHPAYEDVELAYRLTARGMEIVYEPEAVAYQCRLTTRREFRRRARIIGRSLWAFQQKHPETRQGPSKVRPKDLEYILKTAFGLACFHLPSFLTFFVPRRYLQAGYARAVRYYKDRGYRACSR